MKNLLSRYLTGSVLAIALCTAVAAQSSKLSSGLTLPSSKEVAYEDDTKDNAALPANSPAAGLNVSTRATKDFSRTYKNQSSASWFPSNDGWVAVFTDQNVKTRVYYNQKGRLLGTISSYGEDKLPKEIRHLVKSNYYDFNIFHVVEINAADKKIYLVKIEDATSFKTIRVEDGEMTETEAFTKSK
jgi:hypothetical protein